MDYEKNWGRIVKKKPTDDKPKANSRQKQKSSNLILQCQIKQSVV